jgi:hypothetical protein
LRRGGPVQPRHYGDVCVVNSLPDHSLAVKAGACIDIVFLSLVPIGLVHSHLSSSGVALQRLFTHLFDVLEDKSCRSGWTDMSDVDFQSTGLFAP